MREDIRDVIEAATGSAPVEFAPLHGGCVSDVMRVDLADGGRVVVKLGDEGGGLAHEAFRLRYLAEKSRLPVPAVIHGDDRLLIMTWIETRGGLTDAAQEHAAGLLADLHGLTADACGFEHGSLSGGLLKPAPWTASWIEFFRRHRLLAMARAALDSGRLPRPLMPRLEKLAGQVERVLVEPERPVLIHGDMWTGNVLCRDGRIAAFVDPSCYYAHPEQELAYSTLFGTFGKPFFRRYHEIRPIAPGFFEERLPLYNLYHLLIHVRLFGGSYVGAVERTLRHYGC